MYSSVYLNGFLADTVSLGIGYTIAHREAVRRNISFSHAGKWSLVTLELDGEERATLCPYQLFVPRSLGNWRKRERADEERREGR